MPYDTYQFTAMSEASLTIGGQKNFHVGDTIVVPGEATVTVSVLDDDGTLSGDNRVGERADDDTGQSASILGADGSETGNGGRIYAESFYWVSDDQGNRYVLVEIEQEGASGDLFAFHAAYGVPAPGVQLHVEQKVNARESTILPDYADLAGGAVQPPPVPEDEYVFTAYNEFDLVRGGHENLYVGQTIMLPSAATLTVTVDDDDVSLSGDNVRSEYADDETGQTASVRDVNGQEVGNGAKIFAEAYYWVSDAEGRRYMMFEIEQEGTPDDYFVFHASYGVPEAGVELHVDAKRNVKESTVMPDYADLLSHPLGEPDAAAEPEWNGLVG
ncbi:hypothetical protein [Jannaschia sp. W003]|uniref:hypothetical protein n=1 Tax=Jannaschia sp. W003 TaxID=2867012 RepID=UPI0021A56FA0|nr:hypothetical protein [Jannaschia sp. W003]UWQ22587.1 hypothetical protein K3554_06060 [Jannaschia sp. W003]